MVFDFLTSENYSRSMTIPGSDSSKIPFFQIPAQRREDFKEATNELNKLFHKHDVSIAFILNPYIDFVNYALACAIPKTKTGKQPKYSHYVHFGMYTEHSEERVLNDTFGEIYFYSSGIPGKARVIFWRNHYCFVAHFRSTKDRTLYLWRVTRPDRFTSKEIVLFQNSEAQ